MIHRKGSLLRTPRAKLWLLFFGVATAAMASPAPDRLYSPGAKTPLWVSAAAAERGGELRWELFDIYASDHLMAEQDRIRQLSRDGEKAPPVPVGDSPYLPEELCTATSFEAHRESAVRESLAALRATSVGIAYGRVLDISQGFLAGRPASLLSVAVESQSEGWEVSVLQVAYPYAAFAIGRDVFCAMDPGYDYRPEIGDHVLVLPHRPTVDEDRQLLIPESEELIAQKAGGKLVIPDALDGDPLLAAVEDLGEILAALGGQ